MRKWKQLGALALLMMIVWSALGQVWAQENPAEKCGRTLANLYRLIQGDYLQTDVSFRPVARPTDLNYCQALEREMNLYLERVIFAEEDAEIVEGRSENAYAFLDLAARRYVGTMPRGTLFRAMARNSLPSSRMMFVKGENFSVFVDYTFTTLSREEFESLVGFQEYDGDITPLCAASWCIPPTAPPNR
ncbi:MAG: hypothetical protein CUN51_07715 [Candidatus Thermofonsia Clade 1 bacterium]|uniref:Uncharacterized protein n=1 Tax=Candidatus Thermofonsia Clade 1 bacterium TaxID=2364210 RepID=A0A2M8NYN2_9CHLR|nr:MAG: hypothetical protein CUN51_07715 [Candidatus Thermofonsia Clade 1 bacterium]